MAKYKQDQGTYSRTTGMVMLGALAVYGCYTLYYFLLSFRETFLSNDLLGGDVPILGAPVTPALLIAIAAGVLLLLWLQRTLDKPKVADLLIESETEMRKCTWPTWDETFTSSLVVLIVMVFFMALLAGMDIGLNRIMVDYVF